MAVLEYPRAELALLPLKFQNKKLHVLFRLKYVLYTKIY